MQKVIPGSFLLLYFCVAAIYGTNRTRFMEEKDVSHRATSVKRSSDCVQTDVYIKFCK